MPSVAYLTDQSRRDVHILEKCACTEKICCPSQLRAENVHRKKITSLSWLGAEKSRLYISTFQPFEPDWQTDVHTIYRIYVTIWEECA